MQLDSIFLFQIQNHESDRFSSWVIFYLIILFFVDYHSETLLFAFTTNISKDVWSSHDGFQPVLGGCRVNGRVYILCYGRPEVVIRSLRRLDGDASRTHSIRGIMARNPRSNALSIGWSVLDLFELLHIRIVFPFFFSLNMFRMFLFPMRRSCLRIPVEICQRTHLPRLRSCAVLSSSYRISICSRHNVAMWTRGHRSWYETVIRLRLIRCSI